MRNTLGQWNFKDQHYYNFEYLMCSYLIISYTEKMLLLIPLLFLIKSFLTIKVRHQFDALFEF